MAKVYKRISEKNAFKMWYDF